MIAQDQFCCLIKLHRYYMVMCEMISVKLSAMAFTVDHTSSGGRLKVRLPILMREFWTRPGLLPIGFGDSTNFEARPRMHDCVSPMYCVSGNDCLPLTNNKRKANPIPSVVASFLATAAVDVTVDASELIGLLIPRSVLVRWTRMCACYVHSTTCRICCRVSCFEFSCASPTK